MSVDYDTTIAYGLTLTSDQCRAGLRALGKNAGTDHTLDDYVEEPFWNLADELGLTYVITGNSYVTDGVRYVIGPKLDFCDGEALVRCEPHQLALLRAFAALHFPAEKLGWAVDLSIS